MRAISLLMVLSSTVALVTAKLDKGLFLPELMPLLKGEKKANRIPNEAPKVEQPTV